MTSSLLTNGFNISQDKANKGIYRKDRDGILLRAVALSAFMSFMPFGCAKVFARSIELSGSR
jgi:hypothetical protein